MKLLQFIYRYTLNNVWFGISMMLLVGLYVAIGSGMPGVRAYFEMTDLEFFAAWPLKLIMVLLVLNLTVITLTRIPLTPPRYGVWCVHAGIIILIGGMATYYSRKIEGQTIIPVGQTVSRFYDNTSRMLYVKVNGMHASAHTLPELPRFKTYGPDKADYFARRHLVGLEPMYNNRPLKDVLGLKDPVKVDLVGFYPYATVVDRYVEGQGGDLSGVKVTMNAPFMGTSQTEYVLNGEPGRELVTMGASEVRHVQLPDEAGVAELAKSIDTMHMLDVKAPGYQKVIPVAVGGTYELGSSGYTITVEGFDANWPTMDGQRAKLITFMVKGPGQQQFRRQVLMGRETPTDWKLDEPGAGPMGKRQTAPLDDKLQVQYTFRDPFHLAPDQGGEERHTMVTLGGGGKGLTDVAVSTAHASKVTRLENGAGEVEMALGQMHMKVAVARVEGVARDEHVEEVPAAQRSRQGGESGAFQVVLAKVTCGAWSKVVPVPFAQFAREPVAQWTGGRVSIPGTDAELQLQLGQELLALPANVTLDRFELVHYPGGDERSMIQRDFKSHLTMQDPRTGKVFKGVAHMNNPVYWAGGEWLFFQAAWDSEGQRWTILGIGNRPGMLVMTTGCVMMFVGLMYAFYVKPIIIRRMKANAIARAVKAGKKPKKKAEELVSAE